jgi:tetratricopeptide (TPR) repeat protein
LETHEDVDVRLINCIANAFNEMGDYENAIFTYQAMIERIGEDESRQSALARVYNNLGVVYWKLERFAEAEDHLRRAVDLEERYGSPYAVAMLMANLAQVLKHQDKNEEALEVMRQAVALAGQLQDQMLKTELLPVLANHLMRNRLYEEADVAYGKSLELLEAIQDELGLAQAKHDYAILCYITRHPQRALQLAQESLAVFEAYGHAYAQSARELIAQILDVYQQELRSTEVDLVQS